MATPHHGKPHEQKFDCDDVAKAGQNISERSFRLSGTRNFSNEDGLEVEPSDQFDGNARLDRSVHAEF
jgi:hypothetical protein